MPLMSNLACRAWNEDYQMLKVELLEASTQGRLAVAGMDTHLRAVSAIRRAVQQTAKAARLLHNKTSTNETAPAQTTQQYVCMTA